MLGTKDLLLHGDGLLMQNLGFRILSLHIVELCQITYGLGDPWVEGPEGFAPDTERSLI